ncbi:DUF1998 domain-containing protein [Thermobifida halotolerans]|uniref:DUF1998 domain-containing protein n=1 Tax=Thermobifida halotolerans TaxID=483545 RepID=A0A399FV13_9ACTN|nr:DUF1998 domain-containing protein [Thermobifida halotolerans]UOE18857.1 DUF1998 domain-containing protein [Thermobifida halotolerans]
MAKSYQEIRPSQFVTTFGPGSIVETPSGPVVLKSLGDLFTAIGRSPREFEILDERLSRGALDSARIVRMPTNAELGLPADSAIYPTDGFPAWALCTQHQGHQVLYRMGSGCPECPRMANSLRRQKAGREAIRFVTACEAGHLDEVPWRSLVHQGGSPCQTDHYRWNGGGRALRKVEIQCPKCKHRANFGSAYGRTWKCTGRQVETGRRPDTGEAQCSRPARIVQRGAANLRTTEIQTALTILNMPARLHDLLGDSALLMGIRTLASFTRLERQGLLDVAQKAGLSEADLNYLAQIPWREIEVALSQLTGETEEPPSSSVRDAELERLSEAATHGAPVRSGTAGREEAPLFEIHRSGVRTFRGPNEGLTFRVAPVSRLRMVMVQTGYRRLEPTTGQVVPTAFERHGLTWYPGVELFGEGIFVDLVDGPFTPTGGRATIWQSRHDSQQPGERGDSEVLPHPQHVWWHSLAHRLLWALSVDSGYSSAAIRERIYTRIENGVAVGGGILLYTVQPGGDGTLGGLVSLVNRFDRVLAYALQDVDTCSNDPLCAETTSSGGAACYSCLFVSETSCEHRNQGLDRLLLMENLP